MRKLLSLILSALIMSVTLNSCLEDEGATARIQYFGICDTIVYTDSANNLPLDSMIKVSMMKLGCTYTVFEEYAETEEGDPVYAIAQCNSQAVTTWKAMVDRLTLKDIEQKMFEIFSDTLYNHMGIHNSAEINLKPITVKTQLFNVNYVQTKDDYIYLYSVDIAK